MTKHTMETGASARGNASNAALRQSERERRQGIAEAGAQKRQEEDRNEEDAVKDTEEDEADARQDAEDEKTDNGG